MWRWDAGALETNVLWKTRGLGVGESPEELGRLGTLAGCGTFGAEVWERAEQSSPGSSQWHALPLPGPLPGISSWKCTDGGARLRGDVHNTATPKTPGNSRHQRPEFDP